MIFLHHYILQFLLLFFNQNLANLTLYWKWVLLRHGDLAYIHQTIFICRVHFKTFFAYFLGFFQLPSFNQKYGVVVQTSCIFGINLQTQLIHFFSLCFFPHPVQQKPIVCIADNRKGISLQAQIVILLCFFFLVKLFKAVSLETISFILGRINFDGLIKEFDGLGEISLIHRVLCYCD